MCSYLNCPKCALFKLLTLPHLFTAAAAATATLRLLTLCIHIPRREVALIYLLLGREDRRKK